MEQLKARDLMSAAVHTIAAEATIIDAARQMLAREVSSLFVVDPFGQLLGVISEGDLLRRMEIGAQPLRQTGLAFGPETMREHLKSHGRHVEDVMTAEVARVAENTPLAEIAGLMQLMRLKRIPVMSGSTIVGVVSRADILRVLVERGSRRVDYRDGDSAVTTMVATVPR